MVRRPPRSTRTDPLFPYTTLFRSASVIMGFFSVLGFWDTFAASYGFVDDGDKKYKCAYRHGDLRNPQWSGVVAGGDVVIGVRVAHQLDAEPAQIAGNKARSEARRVGKESVRTCRSRWSPDH